MTYPEYGNPDILQLNDVPVPKVGPGSILIRVERAAVNPVDWKVMSGGLDPMLEAVFPVIPGWDVAGTVEAAGPDTPEFSVGDRVAAYARKEVVHGGTYAEYVAVPAESAAVVPADVDIDTAASIPLVGGTALRALETVQLSPDDTLLIHGASGGVGHIAAQLAVDYGTTVIGTASTKNHDRLRELGVTPVAYGDGLEDRVREIAPGGITAVVDFVGGVLDQSLALLGEDHGNRLVSIADSDVEEHGGRWVWVRPDGGRLHYLLEKVSEGAVSVHIDRTFSLAEAAEALEVSKSGEANGKLVIDVTR
ncbi:NADP-dependent oxidoreductase [Corynebacterium glyciniphilum]|uniref:NADP-dependent oxidoreductase n=1 Tax=Corynebacterium glyciniphilum TaxID=1404244 RepID=UPI00264F12E4|nr:NADP-dependent oxidoreductase [Corynebacterium glyciniphilum]MDN6706721.1 NADP-dependent oxidoreductase [Corynebacterium glyciniphilum]